MEDFYTIQGEGAFQGCAAYFIRLGGCDVGCVWCDVKESWDALRHPIVSVATIAARAQASGAPIAVVTGGEPAMHNLQNLTEALRQGGLRTHIETSGAWPLTGRWDWVCLSPKKFKKPVDAVVQQADELKVIVYNRSDFAWAEDYAGRVKPGCRLYLQPEWSREKTVLPFITEYVKQHPQWRISLQVHKYMNIP
ncbi:MAG: 7-carboxy-7-deazaguanine synthase [Cyclobacteriaceae bacterium]|nr:MAG: 7-carboxy-7-deazaguanine synthase [Cyclobacteriaceae bacterium]